MAMEKDSSGYHRAVVEGLRPGARYLYSLGGVKECPDPASRFQPLGVHGASQLDSGSFEWTDQGWQGLPLEDYVLYEIHLGTFTPEGTLDSAAAALDELRELGISAVELMPVAQFPGERNWGYDGVYPFAVQASYGGPQALKRFVNACHARGLAAVVDVVYNHLGPEGNYLADFGPYFTGRYRGLWGSAVNFDGPESGEVRRYFIENALYWITEFHFDALRLDAIHGIFDFSSQPFLGELGARVHERAERLGRKVYVIAESDLNDSRVMAPAAQGGCSLDAQWSDDFHHALHTLLTGERAGYYQDFGQLGQLAKAFREGYVYSGEYSAYRRRRHGNSSRALEARQFVVFAQNHDQVGNRLRGDRLASLVSFESLKLAAGVVILSPFIPLLFMGEEYGETAPFLYFISHGDPAVVEATRRGRRQEFAAFAWEGEIPDPQDEATFLRSKIHPELRRQGRHRTLAQFYQELLRLRRSRPALRHLSKETLEVKTSEEGRVLTLRRWHAGDEVWAAFRFGDQVASLAVPVPSGAWRKELDSEDERWGGSGSLLPDRLEGRAERSLLLEPRAFVVLSRPSAGGQEES